MADLSHRQIDTKRMVRDIKQPCLSQCGESCTSGLEIVYDKSSSLPAQNYNLSFTAQKPDQSLGDLARVLLVQE
jgi:hypothetical protein